MKNKSSKIKSKFLLAGIGALLGLSLVVAPVACLQIESANAEQTYVSSQTADVSVTMLNRAGETIGSASKTVTDASGENELDPKTYTYYSANWSDIARFRVSYNGTLEDAAQYDYKFVVVWTPVEIEGNESSLISADTKRVEFAVGSTLNKRDVIKTVDFYVDNLNGSTSTSYTANNLLGKEYIDNGGWGVYQFMFVCNGSHQSDLYEIEPTKLSDIGSTFTPVVNYITVSNSHSIDNAYLFSITNDELKFIKRTNITWNVSGKAADGTDYVLLKDETSNTEGLYESFDFENRQSFKLDLDKAGNWSVWCTISDGTITKDSNIVDVSTIKIISKSTIIWIIVGCVAGASVILAVIIIVAKKKEKVW